MSASTVLPSPASPFLGERVNNTEHSSGDSCTGRAIPPFHEECVSRRPDLPPLFRVPRRASSPFHRSRSPYVFMIEESHLIHFRIEKISVKLPSLLIKLPFSTLYYRLLIQAMSRPIFSRNFLCAFHKNDTTHTEALQERGFLRRASPEKAR